MTIGKAWMEINQKAIDSDAGTDIESAFRHLRARLAAAKAVKIAVGTPVRLMVLSAAHVSESLQLQVATFTSFNLVLADQITDPLLQRVLSQCKDEGLRCTLQFLSDDGPRDSPASRMYELLVEPE